MTKIKFFVLALALASSLPAHAINRAHADALARSGCTQVAEAAGECGTGHKPPARPLVSAIDKTSPAELDAQRRYVAAYNAIYNKVPADIADALGVTAPITAMPPAIKRGYQTLVMDAIGNGGGLADSLARVKRGAAVQTRRNLRALTQDRQWDRFFDARQRAGEDYANALYNRLYNKGN